MKISKSVPLPQLREIRCEQTSRIYR